MKLQFTESNLQDLVECVKHAKRNKELEKFKPIVNGVVSRCSASITRNNSCCDAEDLVQDLWIKVIELKDKRPDLTESFVATSCYNKMVDLYRYNEVRRRSCPVEPITIDETEDSDQLSGYDACFLKSLINTYPKDSEERRYLVMKFINNGLLERSDLDQDDQKYAVVFPKNTEYEYVQALGYKLSYTKPWNVKRKRLREKIKTLLGESDSW